MNCPKNCSSKVVTVETPVLAGNYISGSENVKMYNIGSITWVRKTCGSY